MDRHSGDGDHCGLVSWYAQARIIPPIVSTEWLQCHLGEEELLVLDTRSVEDYREGHIPGAVNAYAGAWAYKKGQLCNEIPDHGELDEWIGALGIDSSSKVVVVGEMETIRQGHQTVRVACTLLYAGLENVALLNGGIAKWRREGRPLTTDKVVPKAKTFKGRYRNDMFITKEELQSKMGQILMLDVREPDYYGGEKKLNCIQRPGHIPGAINMPTSCAFNADGTFKSQEDLLRIVQSAVGTKYDREIVTYCDTGQCCPTWHYLMRELLGFTNVKIYDGSMQEWGSDPHAPVTK